MSFALIFLMPLESGSTDSVATSRASRAVRASPEDERRRKDSASGVSSGDRCPMPRTSSASAMATISRMSSSESGSSV